MTGTSRELSEAKLIGLEVLRFLSAVAVLVWHYQHFWFVGADPVDFERRAQPLYTYLSAFYEWGMYGVQVFWLISGFIFFWKYLEKINGSRVSGWQFFVLRVSRLYPLHLLTFAIVAALQFQYHELTGLYDVYQANDTFHAFLQLFMASNWGFQTGDSFNGPIWSVSLEVLVYFVFFFFARLFGARQWASLLVAVAAAAAYQARFGQVFQCVFCFFLGGLTAQAMRSPLVSRRRPELELLAVTYVVGAAWLFAQTHWFDNKAIVHLYITTAFPLLILVLAGRQWLSGAGLRIAALAGNTTYSSYLLHFPLQMAIMVISAATGWVVPRESPAFFAAYLVSSIVLGAVAYRMFELPAQQWIRKRLLSS